MAPPDNLHHGICPLSVVPVRAEPSDKAELTTQLLFGDAFIILQLTEDAKWVNIRISYDDYSGWIDTKQYLPVSKTYFEEYSSTPHPYSVDLISHVYSDQTTLPLLIGSCIPFYSKGIADLGSGRIEFKGALTTPAFSSGYKELEAVARQYLGAPYLWGGKSPFGIDCSGFTQQVFKLSGHKLLRDAWQQAEQGESIDLANSACGDLAFFSNAQGRVVHVGILLDGGRIIHASGEVRIDLLDHKGIFNQSKEVYTHKLYSIRRIIKQHC